MFKITGGWAVAGGLKEVGRLVFKVVGKLVCLSGGIQAHVENTCIGWWDGGKMWVEEECVGQFGVIVYVGGYESAPAPPSHPPATTT